MPMTSIPASIWRIYRNSLKHHYLKNKILFPDFLMQLRNAHEIWSIFQKKDEYPRLIISEIIDAERRGYLNV